MAQSTGRLQAAGPGPCGDSATGVVEEASNHGAPTLGQSQERVTTAVVDDIGVDGVAQVVLQGETGARTASSLLTFDSPDAAAHALLGRTVIVLLTGGAPVILGTVSPRLWREGERPDADGAAQPPVTQTVSLRSGKRRIDLDATEEIRLTCGKSALVLRRDGTVVVRGVKIVTHASQTNRIRGGTVSIN